MVSDSTTSSSDAGRPSTTLAPDTPDDRSQGGLAELASRIPFLPPEIQVLTPGLSLCALIALLALRTGDHFAYVTPLVAAMGIGILIKNAFILPKPYAPGIIYALKQVLRLAVALLGVRITFAKIAALGWEGLLIPLVPLVATLIVTMILGKLLRIPARASILIGTGTSVCGASAILTAGATLKSRDEDVVIAIGSITAFGTVSMIGYPLLLKSGLLPLSAEQYGYWAGASIHEVAQVVTASFAGGQTAGEIGIVIKLTRVAALIPLAFILSAMSNRGWFSEGRRMDSSARVAFPVYLLAFLGMVILNSNDFFSEHGRQSIERFDMFLLTMAMAAMGLEVDIRRLLRVGYKPLLLSVLVTAFISGLTLALVVWLIPSS